LPVPESDRLSGPDATENFFNTARPRDRNAPVDRERLLKLSDAAADVAVVQVNPADPFQRPRFLQGAPRSRARVSAWLKYRRARRWAGWPAIAPIVASHAAPPVPQPYQVIRCGVDSTQVASVQAAFSNGTACRSALRIAVLTGALISRAAATPRQTAVSKLWDFCGSLRVVIGLAAGDSGPSNHR
jgi:hypothetical protein